MVTLLQLPGVPFQYNVLGAARVMVVVVGGVLEGLARKACMGFPLVQIYNIGQIKKSFLLHRISEQTGISIFRDGCFYISSVLYIYYIKLVPLQIGGSI